MCSHAQPQPTRQSPSEGHPSSVERPRTAPDPIVVLTALATFGKVYVYQNPDLQAIGWVCRIELLLSKGSVLHIASDTKSEPASSILNCGDRLCRSLIMAGRGNEPKVKDFMKYIQFFPFLGEPVANPEA